MLRAWDDLPADIRNDQVKPYYELLAERRMELLIKRAMDLVLGLIALIVLIPVWIIVSLAIKCDSSGPVLFRQKRVTQYGRLFSIYKFRTMLANDDKQSITTKDDSRITRVGSWLRKYRLDEIPQLINIIKGDMTLVGTRPEVPQYVEKYSSEMKATLLLPAGVTSEASILYKDEEKLLNDVDKAEEIYLRVILPAKMKYNLDSLMHFSLLADLRTVVRTVTAVFVNPDIRFAQEEYQAELASTLENTQTIDIGSDIAK